MKIVNLYKKVGETPLERLIRYKASNNIDVPMTYLGRLDPMAEGVLLVSPGSIRKEDREEILKEDKVYEFRVLLGLASDTGDVLGIVKKRIVQEKNIQDLTQIPEKFIGTFIQHYPKFSSKPVGGVPLFLLARSGKLKKEDIPKKKIQIYSFDILRVEKKTALWILKYVTGKVKKVQGDFRQKRILTSWQKTLTPIPKEIFYTIRCRIRVSSGTYIRVISEKIGKELNTGALALDIVRISVGKYTSKKSLR